MIRTLRIALSATMLGAISAPALADDDARCGAVAAADWLTVEQIAAKAAEAGYTVREVERDDGCYDIEATDKDGREVEVRFHPATGAVVDMDIDD